MKKQYFLMAMAATMFAACSQTEVIDEVVDNSTPKAIGFNTFADKATRSGTNSTNLNDFYTTFNVYGWKSIDGGANWQNVFNNVTNEYFTSDNPGNVVYTSGKPSNEWTVTTPFVPAWYYEGIRYWDKLATDYQFCAYAPIAASTEVKATPQGVITIGEEATPITVDGKNLQATPTNALKYRGFDKDYMTAVSTEKFDEVELTFTHELAKLNVKVQKDNKYKSSQELFVTKLEILNLKNQGYFERDATPSKTWTVSTSSTEGTFEMGTAKMELANPETDDKKYVIEQLLLPQGIKKATEASNTAEFTEACVHITYTIGTEVFDGFYALNNIFDNANDYTFKGGNEYTLTITVGPEPIHFTPEVTEWVEGSNENLPIK